MKAISISAAFTTSKIIETKDFYTKYLGAKVTFDCGWYVNLEFGNQSSSLQFMEPQEERHRLASGDGIIYNIKVDDVDYEYERLMSQGLKAVMAIEDHPWGDRGFSISDPNGISLYIYSDREPSEDFRKYFE